MSGHSSRSGLPVFDLGVPEGATRRGCDAAIARHRRRDHHPPVNATIAEQNEYLRWVTAWETYLIDYRDGNKVRRC